MRFCIFCSLTVFGLVSLSAGCATLPTRAEVPLGEWSGDGSYVIHKWSADDKTADDPQAGLEHGEYPTRLTIEKAEIDGQDAVRIEILSMRGESKELGGDRTHIVALLRPNESLADDTITLYRVMELGISDNKEPPQRDMGSETITAATCMRSAGEIVLCIHYMDEFVDTLRFRGDVVLKDGSYYTSKEGLIHWSERLQRRR
jgi:hypothetical protein